MKRFMGLVLGILLIVSPGAFTTVYAISTSDLITKGPWIDSRAYSTLAAANTAAYNAGKPLYITKNYTLTANTTLTAAVKVLKGGGFTKASTYTLAFTGPVDIGKYKVFYGFGSTDVILYVEGIVRPEWWGADPSDSVDDLLPIESAIGGIQKRGTVLFDKGTYFISGSINVTAEAYVTLRGVNRARTYIQTTGAFSAIIFNNLDNSSIENLTLHGNSLGTNGIELTNTCNTIIIRDVIVQNFVTRGVWFSGQSTAAPVMGSIIQNFKIYGSPIGIEVNFGAGIRAENGTINTFSTNGVRVSGDSTLVSLSNIVLEVYTGGTGGELIYWDDVRAGLIEGLRGESAGEATYIKIVSNDCLGTIIRNSTIVESGDSIQDGGYATIIEGNYLTPRAGYYCIRLLATSNRAQILQQYYNAVSGTNYWFIDDTTNKNYTRMDQVLTRFGGTGGGALHSYKSYFTTTLATASSTFITAQVDGEAQPRVYWLGDVLRLGDGTNPLDVKVGRVAANIFGSLEAGDGLAVGNAATATGAATGMVKKIQIFDHTGASLGYIPVYSAIAP